MSQIKAGKVFNLVMDLFGRIDSDVRLEYREKTVKFTDYMDSNIGRTLLGITHKMFFRFRASALDWAVAREVGEKSR